MEGTNYLEIANSLAMWSAAGLAVAVVLVQALIFQQEILLHGLEMGLPRADEGAIKSSVITAFGPSALDISISLDKNTVSCISGGVIMLVLNMIADKRALKWVREWSLFFALFGGMMALRCSAVPSLQHSTRRMHHERQSCHITKRVPAFIIKWGRITNGAGLLLCFSPALYPPRLRTHASGFGHSQRLFGHHECRWSGLNLWSPFPIS